MRNGVYDLFEEGMSDIGCESAVLVHVVGELSAFDSLQGHRIIYMKLVVVHGLNSTFWDDFSKTDKIRMPLNIFEHVSIINENYFLLKVSFTLQIRPLNNLKGLIFRIFRVFSNFIVYQNL